MNCACWFQIAWIFRKMRCVFSSLRKKRFPCGHSCPQRKVLQVFGTEVICYASIKGRYCPDCLGRMSIRCAWCGKFIFIGDPITLYTPKSSFPVPHYAVIHERRCLVGCLRSNCGELVDRAGFWVSPGRVFPVPTIVEELLSRMRSGEEEPVVICNDISQLPLITDSRNT